MTVIDELIKIFPEPRHCIYVLRGEVILGTHDMCTTAR